MTSAAPRPCSFHPHPIHDWEETRGVVFNPYESNVQTYRKGEQG